MHLVDKDNKPVNVGDLVTDFRGEPSIMRGFALPKHAGSTGRVYTDAGEYYPGVYNLKWSE